MKKIIMALCIISLLVLSACATHIHKIGAGSSQGQATEARQWYVLWGLVPLNNVDSAQMAGGAANYEIKTELSPIDWVFNLFTGIVTIHSRTVTVTK